MSLKGALGETPKGCEGCGFRQVSACISNCGYALITGRLRNCPVEECEHFRAEGMKGDLEMFDIEAPWIGDPDYRDYEYKDEKEEYIPEYYPECDADYDY